MEMTAVAASTLQAIGNTPLVRLHHVVPEDCADIVVKLEAFNPTGSYKDRMALAMIEGAERRGELQLARELGPGRMVATVACDSGLKYLHGGLFTA